MRISVISFKGAPPPRPESFDFDERGGGIGRDEGNELPLADPERHISRLQARIEHDGKGFVLVDHGSNPTLVNGRPVGKGERVTLAGGERITMGSYELEAEFERVAPLLSAAPGVTTTPNDPLGLFTASPATQVAAPASAARAPLPSQAAGAYEDPFAVFAVAPPPGPAAAPVPHTFLDPFASPVQPPAPSVADKLGLGAVGSEPSVDALFGLGEKKGDLFAGTPLGDVPETPRSEGAAVLDPLALFGAAQPAPVPAAQRDDAPLLQQAFAPPRPVAVPPEREPEQQAAAPPPAPAPAPAPAGPRPGGVVYSWGTATEVAAPAAARPARSLEHAQAAIVSEQAEPPASPPPAAVQPAPALPAGSNELLDAFQRGLGVQLPLAGGLSPELMEQVGVMLREATQGTLDLLKARALTKREVRAEATMIVSQGNNPLKFSPDIAFALAQLLTNRSKGFMRCEEAMRDAYDDLRAHQFGFMAGMRAALAGVLKRFEPAELEARVVQRRLLDNLLPASRKARLWDLFEEQYSEISREAADDFHALFGQEFLRAYEEQVELLREKREEGGS